MSSNVLKVQYTYVKQDEKRVIDTNELLAKRVEEYLLQEKAAAEAQEEVAEEGFVGGLNVAHLGVLSEEEIEADEYNENIVEEETPVIPTPEELMQKAMDDIAIIKREASQQLDEERRRVLEEAREKGYAEGKLRAEQEYLEKEKIMRQQMLEMEHEYQSLIDSLEPRFIDTLTGIYEQIFHVELSKYRDVLIHLISSTIRKIEGCKEFTVHVSAEDYPYVSMQKKQLQESVGVPGCSIEIVEDLNLERNECQIETSTGIFDCGLGTELEELSGKLKLLSYERPE